MFGTVIHRITFVYNLCLLIAKHGKDVDLEALIPLELLHYIARVDKI